MQNAILASFFVINDELHRNLSSTSPFRIRGFFPITNHVPRILSFCLIISHVLILALF